MIRLQDQTCVSKLSITAYSLIINNVCLMKNQACVSDLARLYRNHPSHWWKLILVDNHQFSLTVPPNCCEKLDFLAILPPVISFFKQYL